MKQQLKKIITGPADWFLYTLLSEKQRKGLSNLFSEKQKQIIKRVFTGRNYAKRQKLKDIKYHLYNLGFHKQALEELITFYQNEKDASLKRLAAWELALWYANHYAVEEASRALHYLKLAEQGESNVDQLRRITIVKAECLGLLNKKEEAKTIINQQMDKKPHADLYLARANTEEDMNERVRWINKAFEMYQLQPITFYSEARYDDLRTTPIKREIKEGPKVSVILPAYNAEDGIQVAIDSILTQTWKNIELLIVDDRSPDNTLDVIKEYEQRDKRIRVLSTPLNSGPYVARNIALKEATGEFVTVNDSDDWSHAEKIEKQVKHLIANPDVIANTSEHARLTEELKLYRRGTPGRYIFPNMSSLMFRRKPVLEKLGYWDSVRFAADGEFKRRLIKAFGKSKYVDLKSGPLSLPRQSVSSLTSSSAFGYNGFFFGVRKEYVEAMEHHHHHTESLYYTFPMEKRPFPVPEPMWPKREEKKDGKRIFDLIVASDFRDERNKEDVINEIQKAKIEGSRIGLVQINQYNKEIPKEINIEIRQLIDGEQIHLIVFGENIVVNEILIINPNVLSIRQQYIPKVDSERISILINEERKYKLQQCTENLKTYFGDMGTWYIKHSINRDSLTRDSESAWEGLLAKTTWENR